MFVRANTKRREDMHAKAWVNCTLCVRELAIAVNCRPSGRRELHLSCVVVRG